MGLCDILLLCAILCVIIKKTGKLLIKITDFICNAFKAIIKCLIAAGLVCVVVVGLALIVAIKLLPWVAVVFIGVKLAQIL